NRILIAEASLSIQFKDSVISKPYFTSIRSSHMDQWFRSPDVLIFAAPWGYRCSNNGYSSLINFWNDDWFRVVGPLKHHYSGCGRLHETIRRVRVFLWLVVRDRLLTNKEQVRRGMSQFLFFELWGSTVESAIHDIKDCGFVQTVWKMVTSMAYIFMVEAQAMLDGLNLAWDQGFRQVELESDNALLIEAIQNGLAVVSNVDEAKMIHNYYSKTWQLVVIEKPPLYVRDLVEEDIHLSFGS
ncbi:hypothetical protein Gogos_016901, partial [Gossypium gossypioides]|nr:hypothetical protein [Gossypium gossypioides]